MEHFYHSLQTISQWRQDSTTATSSSAGAGSVLLLVQPHIEIGGGGGAAYACAMDDWESVLSEPLPASSGQELSMLHLIMGDVADHSVGGVNKVLQISGGLLPSDVESGSSFGAAEQASGGDSVSQFGTSFMLPNPAFIHCLSFPNNSFTAEKIDTLASNSSPNFLSDIKPSNYHNTVSSSASNNLGAFFNAKVLVNQHVAHSTENRSFLLPAQQQEHIPLVPPRAKRYNLSQSTGGIPKGWSLDTGQELFLGREQLPCQHPLVFPHNLHQRPLAGMGVDPNQNTGRDELGQCDQQQQAIIDQLYEAAELVETGNFVLAQAILARLNHQLSSLNKPFQRAALYFNEAMESVLHGNDLTSEAAPLPFSLIFRIGAYKLFSEISPLTQFTNFTCNQAVLEVLEGFNRIHIVDFDIGYGVQWASLMQELSFRSEGTLSLKITAIASPSTHDQLELCLVHENLYLFANEINIKFEFQVLNIDSLNYSSWCIPFDVSEKEAFAVNLPVGSFATFKLPVPSVLHFVKQLSPKIVVSMDRGCDRTDLPLAIHIIHALQSYSNLLESLNAINMKSDALHKIEKFLFQPGIKRIVTGRFRSPGKTLHWRSLFHSSGFTPVPFSSFTESQAQCVVKRTSLRGYQVEKRQLALVLSWQRKELASVSAWKC
ncbi:scarecrow-like protein 22-like [Dorcoceras hygrometricum]|uniref:Scarecrow-like protein 22-like n=1 Tax=Dorcoceras hygrometricum TaxID=472368 RepID=A0A2Z7BF34_9LAMI|nr:scarecrow-like protein 22-like [Dorcoceras hygrometricum]